MRYPSLALHRSFQLVWSAQALKRDMSSSTRKRSTSIRISRLRPKKVCTHSNPSPRAKAISVAPVTPAWRATFITASVSISSTKAIINLKCKALPLRTPIFYCGRLFSILPSSRKRCLCSQYLPVHTSHSTASDLLIGSVVDNIDYSSLRCGMVLHSRPSHPVRLCGRLCAPFTEAKN